MPITGLAVLAVAALATVGFALTAHEGDAPAITAYHAPSAAPSDAKSPAALKPVAAGSTVMFVGDSWTAGTGADDAARGYPYFAAEKLGVKAAIFGYGSVGYVNTGTTHFGAFQARLDHDSPTEVPALIVLQGSQNDTQATPAAITAAARALVADVRARFPKAQMVMVGPAPATVGLMGPLAPVDAALAEAAGAEKVPYISPLREQWFNAGNLPGYINPMDGSPHPNTAGHQNFGARLAAAIKALT